MPLSNICTVERPHTSNHYMNLTLLIEFRGLWGFYTLTSILWCLMD